MGISLAQYLEMSLRVSKRTPQPKPNNPVEREKDLHQQIMDWCNGQFPRVKYIHSRMDMRSTVDVGAPDFVLFLPNGRALIVELKRKGGKCSAEQLGYHKELEMLGHKCHVVYSMEQFIALLTPPQTSSALNS